MADNSIIKECVEVNFNFRKYFVHLKTETVFAEIQTRKGKAIYRRVTSRRIETACVLQASDKAHSPEYAQHVCSFAYTGEVCMGTSVKSRYQCQCGKVEYRD